MSIKPTGPGTFEAFTGTVGDGGSITWKRVPIDGGIWLRRRTRWQRFLHALSTPLRVRLVVRP